jgi:CRP-like cAMP-binding protein
MANRLLGSLDRAEAEALSADLETVELPMRVVLHEPGLPMPYVYLPISGVLSLLVRLTDGREIEVGQVGSEGMVDVAAFLGAQPSETLTVVQVPGLAHRILAGRFRKRLEDQPQLRAVVGAYVLEFVTTVTQMTACNRVHRLEQRMARWLLLTEDRAGSHVIPVTQESLADMIGASRPKVTEAATRLRAVGAISYRHGFVTIEDRAALETLVCECYGLLVERFRAEAPAVPMRAGRCVGDPGWVRRR